MKSNSKIFFNVLLCTFLPSAWIIGGESPAASFSDTARPELHFYTSAEINPKNVSIETSAGAISEEESMEKIEKIYILSGNEMNFKQEKDTYSIQYDGKTFLLPKSSVNSPTLSYFDGALYCARLTKNPDEKTLNFQLHKCDSKSTEEDQIKFYFELLKNGFISANDFSYCYDCESLIIRIKNDFSLRSPNWISINAVIFAQKIILMLENKPEIIVPIIRENIDQISAFSQYISHKMMINILEIDQSLLLSEGNLEKFFESSLRDGHMYLILQEAAAEFKKNKGKDKGDKIIKRAIQNLK